MPKFEQMLMLRAADRYALASRGHLQAQLSNFEEAIASLQQLTRLAGSAPQKAAAWFNLGFVLQRAGRHDDAVLHVGRRGGQSQFLVDGGQGFHGTAAQIE